VRFITEEQLVTILDSLERSENFPALRILDSDRYKMDSVPFDGRGVMEIPFPLEKTHICTFDVARILYDDTDLPGHWTILREALKLNPGEWAAAIKKSQTDPLLDVIRFAFDIWSGRLGLGSTVGVVCDSLTSLGHQTDAGKERKRN
jgi:hypothetical protein